MLELMLAGNNVTIIPGSGPGNKKLLAGDKTNGWFGMIDPGELPLPQPMLNDAGGGIASMPAASTVPLRWLKAVIDGKFIFVANTPFNTGALLDIYNRGQIFGTDDNGISPPSNRYNDQNQLRIVTGVDRAGKTWAFRLRVLSASSNDNPTAGVLPSSTELANSESFKLYSHIVRGVTATDGKRWDELTPNVDIYNAWFVSRTVAGTKYVSRTPVGASNYAQLNDNTNTSYYWFPVLEVIDPDVDLIPPVEITAESNKLSGTGPVVSSNAPSMIPSELTIQPQVETAAYTKTAVDDAITMLPSELNMLNHAERPAAMKQ